MDTDKLAVKYITTHINNAGGIINDGHATLLGAVKYVCNLLRAGRRDIILHSADPVPLLIISNGALFCCKVRPYLRQRVWAAMR